MNHYTKRSTAAETKKNTKFLEKVRFLCSKKALQRYVVDFCISLPSLYTCLAKRPAPFFQFLETTKNKHKFIITPEVLKYLDEIIKILHKFGQLALRQPLPDEQLILKTNTTPVFKRQDTQY